MKTKLLVQLTVIVLVIGVSEAFALLNIYTTANPFITPGYNINTTSSGIVEYTVYHEAGSTNALNFYQLRFDTAVFSSFSFISALINGTTSVGFSSAGDLLGASSFSLAPGASLVIRVAYAFVGGVGASALTWPEGQTWAQSYAGLSFSPGFAIDGGSSELAPEPGTILLLGSGLLGLGLAKRYLRRSKSS